MRIIKLCQYNYRRADMGISRDKVLSEVSLKKMGGIGEAKGWGSHKNGGPGGGSEHSMCEGLGGKG